VTRGRPPWRRAPRGFDQVPDLSAEEVQRRVDGVGGAPEPPPDWDAAWQADPGPETAPLEPARSFGPGAVTQVESGSDRRRLLWRDSATILIFVVIALLVAQAFPAGGTGQPASSDAIPSGEVVGSLPPGFSLPPGVTFGPIIDPSLGIDATPTPIPARTETPTPTPGPTPTPSAKPTPKPSKTPTPTHVPPPTPAPPAAGFTWSTTGLQVDFTNTSTGSTLTYSWDFGDPGDPTGSTAKDPSHTYVLPGTYVVTLTVSGPGGPDDVATHNITVDVLPGPT
jgi:PKD domain